MKIRVGSRDSRLAIIQAEMVIDAIKQYDNTIETELVTMKTTGDMILDKTLDKIGGKGLFVKELDRALRDKEVDITVHSLKDMPMETPDDLPIVAYSKREDPMDVMILPEGKTEFDESLPIGCSSARRRIQLKKIYPNAEIKPLRGNVQTRLRKLDDGEFGAIVLAAAGIRRLSLEERIYKTFTEEEIIPAAGQGIIAVQARDGENTDFLQLFHDNEAMLCANAERSFVKYLNGGCSSPVACFANVDGEAIKLRGMFVNEDETKINIDDLDGMAKNGKMLGKVLALALKHR